MFPWRQWLARQNIPMVTTPGMRRRGYVSVACPWCGSADAGAHLGINVRSGSYHCFRSPQHRGRDPSLLIAQLLRCGRAEATAILMGETVLPARLGWHDTVSASARPTTLSWPPEIKPLTASLSAAPFWEYLRGRGYSDDSVEWLVHTYDLHYAKLGYWHGRIIVPIKGRDGTLLSWVGRTISPAEPKRYLNLGNKQSLLAPKQTILGLDVLWAARPARLLVVCEGPFDAFRISAAGAGSGIYGTALFGLSISEPQTLALLALEQHFERVVFVLDSAAGPAAWRLAGQHRDGRFDTAQLPPTVKDPGALTPQAAFELCLGLIGG